MNYPDVLFQINNPSPIGSPLFGDTQRVIRFDGSGEAKTAVPESDIGTLKQDLSNTIISNGWGLQTLTLEYGWGNLIFGTLYPSYNFSIWINALPSSNPETIRSGLQNILNFYFGSVDLVYNGDNAYTINPTTGQTEITNYYNDKTPQSNQPTLWEQIFGKNTSAVDASGKVLGLSVGTIALIGIGYLFITKRK